MTIDETVDWLNKRAYRTTCYGNKVVEHHQYVEIIDLLEELKEYRKGFTEARNKDYETAYAKGFNDGCAKFSVGQDYNNGIDDFVKELKKNCEHHYIDCDGHFGGWTESIIYEDDIEEIAEQLKGENNG